MTHGRFLRKLKAYWHLRAREANLFLPRSFRVLTIARSPERTENLLQTAKEADSKHKGSRMFYFASENAYSLERPETMLDYIWRCPADAKPHSLLEGKRAKERD